MIRSHVLTASLLAAALTGSPALADDLTLKLATLAPDGSVWHKALKEMAHESELRTDGRVKLVIYAGGVAGDDPAIVRKIRTGRLHAAALTISGLVEIEPAFNVFSIPLFFDSYEEYLYVRERLTPELERRAAERGYLLLHWGHGGWIYLFSKKPVQTVEDLKTIKLFTWAGDDSMAQAWKSNGFRAVPLAATDIMTGLQTGLIDALPTTPLAALTMQWYRHTPYMIEPGVAPLVAATVVELKAWEKISAADRAAVVEIARGLQARLVSEIPAKDDEAVVEMGKRGLTRIEVDRGDAGWSKTARSMESTMLGTVPKEILDRALEYRAAFRRRSAGQAE